VIIDRALRDEGTSYHYAPPAEFAEGNQHLVAMASKAMSGHRPTMYCRIKLDKPTRRFRETAEAINVARDKGILAVEMEAAALLHFREGGGRGGPLPCPCHKYHGTDGRRF